MVSQERIQCSAVWFRSDGENSWEQQPINVEKGFVICGLRHCNCFASLLPLTDYSRIFRKNHIQGFLTNKNRFVGREEGYQIAKDAGQLIPRDGQMEGRLDSSDLY